MRVDAMGKALEQIDKGGKEIDQASRDRERRAYEARQAGLAFEADGHGTTIEPAPIASHTRRSDVDAQVTLNGTQVCDTHAPASHTSVDPAQQSASPAQRHIEASGSGGASIRAIGGPSVPTSRGVAKASSCASRSASARWWCTTRT